MTVPATLQSPVAQSPVATPGHSALEDAVGIVTGAFVASLGLFFLQAAGAVTGGTAGLGLLLQHAVPWSFAAIYLLVNLPFLLLAGTRRSWAFAARSVASVALVSGFSLLHPHLLVVADVATGYGILVGNLAVGIGILILFRHRSSLGGFNVVALLCQERLGWRAGWVQLALDASVILLSSLVVAAPVVLWSAAGAVVLNVVLAMNHRPGRYAGM